MKAKRNSWHYWLYQSSYGSAVPYNLCPYFWGLVLSIAFLPITWYLHLLNLILERHNPSAGPRHWWGPLFAIVLTSIGGGMQHDDETKTNWILDEYGMWPGSYYCFLLGCAMALLLALVLSIIFWAIYLFDKIIDKYRKPQKSYYDLSYEERSIYWAEKERKEKKRKWMLIEFIKAKYNRYCPKIDWHD